MSVKNNIKSLSTKIFNKTPAPNHLHSLN